MSSRLIEFADALREIADDVVGSCHMQLMDLHSRMMDEGRRQQVVDVPKKHGLSSALPHQLPWNFPSIGDAISAAIENPKSKNTPAEKVPGLPVPEPRRRRRGRR